LVLYFQHFKAAIAGSADDLSVKDASAAKSDISGGNGTVESGSGSAADNGAVPGNSGAKVPVASTATTDFKKCRSPTAILNLVRLGIKRYTTKEPSANDPLIEEFVVTNVVDGETFKGRALTKECAKAYAAEEALVKLFGMTFEKDKSKSAYCIPIFVPFWFSQDCSLLSGSLTLEVLLISVHYKKRYGNV